MAYMPQSYVDGMNTTWTAAMVDFYAAGQDLASAGYELTIHGQPGAGAYLTSASDNMVKGIAHWNSDASNTYKYFVLLAMQWIQDNLNSSGGAALTMGDILTVMLAANFSELQTFIGIEQAYMAAIWNAPYNHEYYSALARGFRQWP
jgi:hypothetical protein